MAIKRMEQAKSSQYNTRILGRKRFLIAAVPISQKSKTRRPQMERVNILECVPQDMLIKVLCKVDHCDLKHLMLVSKTVSEATLVAREIHHLYNTPRKALKRLKSFDNDENTPGAPVRHRVARSALKGKDLASVAVALFSNDED